MHPHQSGPGVSYAEALALALALTVVPANTLSLHGLRHRGNVGRGRPPGDRLAISGRLAWPHDRTPHAVEVAHGVALLLDLFEQRQRLRLHVFELIDELIDLPRVDREEEGLDIARSRFCRQVDHNVGELRPRRKLLVNEVHAKLTGRTRGLVGLALLGGQVDFWARRLNAAEQVGSAQKLGRLGHFVLSRTEQEHG